MKVETKVGLLFIVTVGLVIGFAYVMGAFNPFSDANNLRLTFNFAGGIEVGSSVRVMGVKVGKVKEVRFDPDLKDDKGNEVKLIITISVAKKAWKTVKSDSKFFINLAGVIGEKFIEISPGSRDLPELEHNAMVRGEDPPRIDQLISQSYGLAGKILEMVEDNETSVVDMINNMNGLVKNLDKFMVKFNGVINKLNKFDKKAEVEELLSNMVQITGDVAAVSDGLRTEDTKKTLKLMKKLIWRLEELDKDALKKFFQDEGIRARMF